MLRDSGYYVETLGSPLTCFDARQYGTLMLADLEDEYFEEEIEKLRFDVQLGLGLAVFSDWYNVDTMVKMRFFDDNTRSWWTPVTGGANVPALNDLLAPFGIAFGDKILNGDFSVDGEQSRYVSGTDIVKFPADGFVHSFPFLDTSECGAQNLLLTSGLSKEDSPILGFVEAGKGRIAVYGDSNCLDSSHMVTNCYWLLRKILEFTSGNVKDPLLFNPSTRQKDPLYVDDHQLHSCRTDVNFSTYSAVVGKGLICRRDSRFEVWGTMGYNLHVRGRSRKLPGFPVIDLGRGLNSTAEFFPPSHPKTGEKKNGDTWGNSYLGLLYKDDLDAPILVASHWFIPALISVTGFAIFLGFLRLRQRRCRRRKSSRTGRFTNS